MNSTLTVGYSGGNNGKKEDIVSYVGPFEYIREKCSECSKAERCMLSVAQRLRCLGPVRNSCETSHEGIGHLLDKLEYRIPVGFHKKVVYFTDNIINNLRGWRQSVYSQELWDEIL